MINKWEQSSLYICAFIFILSVFNTAILESRLKRPKMIDIKSVPTGYRWHSLPLHYATVNQVKNNEDLNPQNFHLKFGNYSDYSFGEEMGEGSTCYVYSGNKISTGQGVVLKKFENKTYRYQVKTEVLFLQSVRGHPNILEMHDIIQDSNKSISIVFLKVKSKLSSSATFEDLNDLGNRFYLYKMLEVLDFAHSHGIIHGDIKPDNIIVNPKTNLMYIIDWGQGCFYIPGISKQTKIGTRRYKSPELFMNFEYFDYGTDIFAVGMVMCEWMFRSNFTVVVDQEGDNDNRNLHLDKFARIFGSQAMREYMQKFQMQERWVDYDIREYPIVNLSKFIDEDNRQFCSEEAMDLLNKILVLDHVLNYIICFIIKQSKRLSAKQALQHSYFDPVRD